MSLHALYGIKGTICALNKLIITSRYQMVHAHVCIKASTLQMHSSIKRDVNSELPELVQLTFWPCANVSAIYLQNKRSTEGKTKTSKKTWVSIPRILVLFLHSCWNCITPQLKDQHSNVNSNLLENYRLQSIMGNFMQVPCSSTSACFGKSLLLCESEALNLTPLPCFQQKEGYSGCRIPHRGNGYQDCVSNLEMKLWANIWIQL